MKPQQIITVDVRYERDIVVARQRARQISQRLGFDVQDQTRIATAVSELARNAFGYGGSGKVTFSLEGRALGVVVEDHGPGIDQIDAILAGTYRSSTGMGIGIAGAKRLMDAFAVETARGKGTRISAQKALPRHVEAPTMATVAELSRVLCELRAEDPFAEIRHQNHELIAAMDELKRQQGVLEDVNAELAETNRGVLALYSELEDKATSLQRANEFKTRFLANVTHEFRTPLNAVLALVRMLLGREDGELTAEQERQVLYIRRSVEELYEFVNDLLDIAKVEAGKSTVRRGEILLSDLFATLRGMLRPLVPEGGPVELVFEDPGEDVRLESDAGKLTQILRNFIANALKFTEKGEVRVAFARSGSDYGVFSVRDTGIGIDPSDQQRIFDEFVQVDAQKQGSTPGTGLGLPLARKLAALLGGRIFLVSEAGVGSCFSLAMKLIAPQPDAASPMEDRPEGESGRLECAARRVLIVDDSEIARYVLSDTLRREGHEVTEATDGPSALLLAKSLHPDVVFLDLAMPLMGGAEVLAQLKRDPATAEIPVVINTSTILSADEIAALKRSAAAVISKNPEQSQASLRTMREVLRGAPHG